jgi:hypothetical protein
MLMTLSLSPPQLLKGLSCVIATLFFMHVLMLIADYGMGRDNLLELRTLFDLNGEQNLPTLFSTLQLLLAAGLLLLLANRSRLSKRADGTYWVGLALVFAFLATDEFCELHEKLIGPLRRMLHPTGALSFAWVIPYTAFVLVFAAAYCRFWWRLPTSSRKLFAVAAAIYVGGGIGMEMVGSKIFTVYGWHSFQFDAQTLVEEFMEMFGVALFVYALAELVPLRMGELTLVLGSRVSTEADGLLDDATREYQTKVA